jgi:hypothetical protein
MPFEHASELPKAPLNVGSEEQEVDVATVAILRNELTTEVSPCESHLLSGSWS